MTAPALILLGPETPENPLDSRGVRAIIDLAAAVHRTRPDIAVQPAFSHDFSTVIDHLVSRGHDEIVVVPAVLAGQDSAIIHSLETMRSNQPTGISIIFADPLGLDGSLLTVIDERLRTVLAQHQVRELDALVLAGHGSKHSAINAALNRAARIWGNRHHLPTIAAFGTHVPPAVSEAVRAHRADGRRHIAVGRMFLTHSSLSDRVGELAIEAGAVAVSEPLGSHAELSHLVLTRYAVGSLQLLPIEATSAAF